AARGLRAKRRRPLAPRGRTRHAGQGRPAVGGLVLARGLRAAVTLGSTGRGPAVSGRGRARRARRSRAVARARLRLGSGGGLLRRPAAAGLLPRLGRIVRHVPSLTLQDERGSGEEAMDRATADITHGESRL